MAKTHPFPSIFYPAFNPTISIQTQNIHRKEQLQARAKYLRTELENKQLSPIFYKIFEAEYLGILDEIRRL